MGLKQVEEQLNEIKAKYSYSDPRYFEEQLRVLNSFTMSCFKYKQNRGTHKYINVKEVEVAQVLADALAEACFCLNNGSIKPNFDIGLFNEKGNLRVNQLNEILTIKNVRERLACAQETSKFVSLDEIAEDEIAESAREDREDRRSNLL